MLGNMHCIGLKNLDFETTTFHAGFRLKSKRPVLVDFWAEWCGPCRTLAPIVEAIAEQYGEAAQVFKLNVDDSPAVAQRYGIQEIPILILFQDGVEKERILGVASQEKISRT